MDVTIRAASPTDASDIAELLGELGYPSKGPLVHKRIEELLGRSDYYILVAELEGKGCGLGVLHVYPTLHAEGLSALISALVVNGSMRGKGLGRRIVADLESEARKVGCKRIMVTTGNDRSDAHSFYERLAYDFTGRRYAKEL